ncbi:transporter suffix domain-containing protein [Methylobacterium nonmethylotrophicum]|nr:transporter suffix domain-containing protein [Methylobacterium nonmethylotrophicum]
MAREITSVAAVLPTGWRLRLGFVLFPLALIPYGLLSPIVFHGLPVTTVATLVGIGVILQKVLFVSAIAVLGKPGFAFLKQRLFNRIAPQKEVGPTRYKIGLIMFCLPIVEGFLEPYAGQVAPDLVKDRFWVDALMDVMQIASVFVLGGNFWDKLRALFVRDACVIFP